MKFLRSICVLLGALLFTSSAWAASTSYQATLGSGAGFGAWCVGGSGASCSGGVFWPGTVITTSGGVELFTTGNAGYVQPGTGATWAVTGTFWQATQPVSATALPLPTGAATSANQSTEITSLATIATNTGAAIPAGTNTIGNVGQVSQYPAGATAITASATGTTAATTATLAGTSGKTTYICGYSIRANATGATTVTDTITGVITGTLSSILWVAPLASGIGVDEQIFSPCIPASGTNTGIAIVSGAPGSGGTVSSKGWGYQL